jgi:hypothetical protein
VRLPAGGLTLDFNFLFSLSLDTNTTVSSRRAMRLLVA